MPSTFRGSGLMSLFTAALLAVVVFIAPARGTSALRTQARGAWAEASAVGETPFLHAAALQRGDAGARALRRNAPALEVPRAPDTRVALPLVRAGAALAWTSLARPATALASRGYDATAPPLPDRNRLS